jgi:thiol-disulfide isomerase/thioredoxin
MANIVDFISSRIKPYNTHILYAFLIIVFIGLSYYAYTKYFNLLSKSNKKYSDVANSDQTSNELEIMMFHVDWCPFCIKSLPEWKDFCRQYNGKKINGYTIRCDEKGTNCTDDNDPKIKALLDEHSIKSYPTVILFKGSERYDFDAKLKKSNLEQFVKTVTSS